MSLMNDYIKLLADKVSICVEDLNDIEMQLIKESFYIFNDRLQDLKTLQDEVKRLSIDNANLKAYQDDKDYPDADYENDID